MGAVVVLWLLGRGMRRRWPQLNVVCLTSVLLLLCAGWWMVLNAKGQYNPFTMQLELRRPLWNAAPGTAEKGFSLSTMQRLSGLLGILCFASDLAQRPIWRVRVWWTMGLTGASLILFGLVERIAGAPMIFWEGDRTGHHFFATYFYYGNAGAFINLVLPLIAGLAVIAFSTNDAHTHLRRMLWAPAVLVCVAGAFVNISRAAQGVAVILMIILTSWRLAAWVQSGHHLSVRTAVVYGCAILIGLVAIGALAWSSVGPRWAVLSQEISTLDGRLFALKVCQRMIPDVGLLGFGPGTFEIDFPFYITPDETAHIEEAAEHWRYAHEDYLQTLIEWGWAGCVPWAALFAGGVVTGLSTFFRGRRILSPSDRVFLFACVTALIGIALHAFVDFPLQIASLQLYAAVCLGVCWGSRAWLRGSKSRPSSAGHRARE